MTTPRIIAAAGMAIAGFVGLGLLLRLLPPALASGDAAVTEIFVLHVTRGPWGLGPYSQFYWNHPGPLMFQLLAPLYVLSGQHAQALNAGATIVNLAAIAALLRMVARAGEPVATVAASSALCVWLLRAPDTLSSFWNPVLIALPAALFVWMCARAAAGGPRALVGLVAVGSFLAQSHVGLVPPVGVLSIVATAIGWRRASREPGPARSAWLRWAALAAAIGGALWALPLYQELSTTPGNLTTLARFFADTPRGDRTVMQSATIWADALTQLLAPAFHQPIGVPVPIATRLGLVALAVAQVAALTVMAWCTRRRPLLARPAAFHALVAVVGFAAVHRAPGLVGDYTVFWLAPVGAMGLALIGAWGLFALGSAVARDVALGRWVGTWLPAGTLILAVGTGAFDLRQHLSPIRGGGEVEIAALDRRLRDGFQARGIHDPRVDIADEAWAEAAAALLQMYKRREAFAVDPAWTFMYGSPLTQTRCHTHRLRFAVEDDGRGEPIGRMGRVQVGFEPLGPCRAD